MWYDSSVLNPKYTLMKMPTHAAIEPRLPNLSLIKIIIKYINPRPITMYTPVQIIASPELTITLLKLSSISKISSYSSKKV